MSEPRIDHAAFQQIWDYFFQAETGTYEKSLWLDILLSEILAHSTDGVNIASIESVCPLESLVTLVACELLCGIHRTTSSPCYENSRKSFDLNCDSSDVSDPPKFTHLNISDVSNPCNTFEPIYKNDKLLLDYTLKGTGWRCLAVLEKLDLKGLSCHRQLGKILLWLFDEINKTVNISDRVNPHITELHKKVPVYDLISIRIQSSENENKVLKGFKKKRKNRNNSKFRPAPKAGIPLIKKKGLKTANLESSDSEFHDDMETMCHSFSLKSKFNYKTPYCNTEFSPNLKSLTKAINAQKHKISATEYITEKIQSILNSEINQNEFNILVLNLLYKLCIIETGTSETETLPINVQCVNFSIKYLCHLQNGTIDQAQLHFDTKLIAVLKISLLEILMVSIDRLLHVDNPFFIFINQEVFELSINLLEEISNAKENDGDNPPEYIFGISYTVLILLFSMMTQKCSIENLKTFREIFKKFSCEKRSLMIQNCINLITNSTLTDCKIKIVLVKRIVDILGIFIIQMKKIRFEAIHVETCPKNEHNICLLKSVTKVHHHRNILGSYKSTENNFIKCSVSFLYQTLTSFLEIFSKKHDIPMILFILKCMQKCGTCCCFSPQYLMESIIPITLLSYSHVAHLCFAVLERTLYSELGKISSEESECELCINRIVEENKTRHDSSSVLSDVNKETLKLFPDVNWIFLKKYCLLFNEEDITLINATANHFLRIAANCDTRVKHDVLFSVLYPLFENTKTQYLLTKSDKCHYKIKLCLKLFPHFLCNVAFVEEFIQKGGLNNIMELMTSADLIRYYCSVLEIIIKCGLFKIKHDSNGLDSMVKIELQSSVSLELLFTSLENLVKNVFKYFKILFGDQHFSKITDLSKYFNCLVNIKFVNRNLTEQYITEDNSVFESCGETSNLMHNFSIKLNESSPTEIFRSLSMFLEITSSLCTSCPLFRKYLLFQDIFQGTFILLKLIWNYLNYDHSAAPGRKAAMRILESLIVIGFSMADCTMNESKRMTSQIMSDAIASDRGNEMECSDIKELIELLLRVSYVVISEEHVSPQDLKMKLSYLNLNMPDNEDFCSDCEEDKVVLQQYISEESELYHTADEGYEADEENYGRKITNICMEQGFDDPSLNTTNSPKSSNRRDSFNEVEILHRRFNEYKQYNPMMFPELCKMAIDLLSKAIERLLIDTKNDDVLNDSTVSLNNMTCSCFDQITSILSLDANYMSGNEIIQQILSSSTINVFQSNSNSLRSVQCSLSNLIYVLATRNITPLELKLYISLFTFSIVPLNIILQPLIKLSGNIQDNIPDFILRFPMEKICNEINNKTMNLSESQNSSIDFFTIIQNRHFKMGIPSCWTTAGIGCCIDEIDFNIWGEGFSFSMWLQIQNNQPSSKKMNDLYQSYGNFKTEKGFLNKSNKSTKDSTIENVGFMSRSKTSFDKLNTNCSSFHLLSIGHDLSVIEFWGDCITGDMVVKVVHPTSNANRVIGEKIVERCFPLFKWNHVAINVKQLLQKRTVYAEITIYVNEHEEKNILIPLSIAPIQKSKPNFLLLGHSITDLSNQINGCWYLSGLNFFRTPIFDRKTAMFLIASGPNTSPVSICKIEKKELNLSSLFTESTLSTDFEWDDILDSNMLKTKLFQKNILLSYYAHTPSAMQIYNNNASNITVFKGKTKKIGFPQFLSNFHRGSLLISQHKGLAPAVYLAGGPQLLLYLFARVIELDGSSEEQAHALSVLLKVSFSDSRLYSMLYNDDVFSMLQYVLLTPNCNLSLHTVKAIIDAACSCSVLININNQFHILSKSNAVIKHPDILILLLQLWKQLECAKKIKTVNSEPNISKEFNKLPEKKEQNISFALNATVKTSDMVLKNYDLLESLFLSIEVLLRDSHPYRVFNIFQLNRVNMVDQLLLFCKERFLNSDMERLSSVSSCSVIEIIRSLIGFPPRIDQIVQLVNFLILMHKASETYVTHSRNSFYFLIWPVKPVQHKTSIPNLLGIKIPFMNKKRGKRKLRLRRQNAIVKFLNRVEHIVSNENTSYTFNTFNEERQSILSNKDSVENDIESNINKPSTSKARKKPSNIQIKYGRMKKHKKRKYIRAGKCTKKRSNSISNIDKKTICARHGSSLMKEYVVIDSDEIDYQSYSINTIKMEPHHITLKNLKSGSLHSWTICKGLLNLLKESTFIMPDVLFRQVLGVVLNSDALLILSNHEDASVRTHVVHVIYVLIQRSSTIDYRKFEDCLFFYHLANQISQYPATSELVAACASLITGYQASLKDQIENEAWADVGETSILRSAPLVSILKCTMHDTGLLKNTVILLKRVIEKGNIKILNEICISEGIIKCLQTIGNSEEGSSTNETILEHIRSLLSSIILKLISFQQSSKNITYIYSQLSYLEREYRSRVTENKFNLVSNVMRDTQSYLMNAELDHIEDKIKELNLKQQNVLTTGSLKASTSMKNIAISQFQQKKIIPTELQTRYIYIMSNVSAFFLCRDVNFQISTMEQKFIKRVFSILVHLTLQENKEIHAKWWGGDNDWLLILSKIFRWIISPVFTSTSIQTNVLKSLRDFPHIRRLLTPSDLLSQRKIAVYLRTLVEKLTKENYIDESIKDMMFDWVCNLLLEKYIKTDALSEEANHLAVSDINEYVQLEVDHYPNDQSLIHQKEWLVKKLIENAMSITRAVVEIQNVQRKGFMNHLRQQQSKITESVHKWQKMVEKFSHEKGPWYFQSSYPKSWEIDSTEGPDRVRVRLKPCHLNIKSKFLKDKNKNTSCSIPLSYLFEYFNKNLQNNSLQRLHLNESISFMIRAIYVTVKNDQYGELLLSDRYLHFMPDSKKGEESITDFFWPLDSIVMMVTRRWQLRESAIELFLSSGHAELIAFETTENMESFLNVINKCHISNRINTESVSDIINLWRNGEITNWKYLMQLNGLAGRTYNDLMQYPVMPFILADYTSEKLHLTKSKSFRDLMKPMAVQNKQSEKHYIDNYNHLKQARIEGTCLLNANKEPFHYGSHYSNSGTVLHFLVRLPPFTNLFLNYQDNNFDIPDRTFHSLQTTWRLASCESTTDVKELIPEFFYQSHFLCNSEGLDFGYRQNGAIVDDVLLPPWAKNSRLFVLIHRQALESAYVKENLPNWVDLVFGYKQTGQAAIDAVNVFHPATYYGFDVNSIADELERNAWETMIKTYGQTPRQLFKHPHPHCITDLGHSIKNTFEVLPTVSGLRWGRYCGSPQEPIPIIISQRLYVIHAQRLLSLNNNEVIGLPANTTLLVTYCNKNKDSSVARNVNIRHVDLITWGYPDGIIRIKQHKDGPLEPLYSIDSLDNLRVVTHGKENNSHTLWLGLQSGRIIVLTYIPANVGLPVSRFLKKPTYLYGHYDTIVSIYICDSFGVAVTASKDGNLIIWDTHNLTYVRSIQNPYHTVSDVYISETLCDIATVHIFDAYKTSNENIKLSETGHSSKTNSKNSHTSKIRVNTINQTLVGEIKINEKVTSICYSWATEGISVNSIAVGLHSGSIKFFSSWDLKPLLCLIPASNIYPIISLVYSHDCQYLYTAASDGTIMVWESATKSGSFPNYRILTSYPVF